MVVHVREISFSCPDFGRIFHRRFGLNWGTESAGSSSSSSIAVAHEVKDSSMDPSNHSRPAPYVHSVVYNCGLSADIQSHHPASFIHKPHFPLKEQRSSLCG
jgi:hypothetical protein